jgi:hypothetical protein
MISFADFAVFNTWYIIRKDKFEADSKQIDNSVLTTHPSRL